MKQDKVKIKLHGHLGDAMRSEWNLAVTSVGEAIHAIQVMTGKLYKYLYDKDLEGAKYKVLVNGRACRASEGYAESFDILRSSDFCAKFKKLETIDIVPVIEAADADIGTIIVGALLIVVGVILSPVGGWVGVVAGAMIIGGIGLVAAGIINLLSSPPKFEDFREIKGGGKASYLFSGPQNVTNEGGPVPIVYGRLLVGSQVIGASYEVSGEDAKTEPLTS
jgi:predicted phage tail protein